MAKKNKQSKAPPDPNAPRMLMRNRRVHHDYEILDSWEAGLVLQGSEIKSIRAGDVQWADAHARFDRRGEFWLHNLYIGEYRHASVFNHLPTAPRKLLLKARELRELEDALKTKGLTVVPTELRLRRGFAKMVIALVRGKKHHDKRADMLKRASDRDMQREMARRQKYG